METISRFFRDWVDKILIDMGLANNVGDGFNRWIILLFIILFALLIDLIIRSGLTRLLHQIVQRTKAKWDDHLFDKR